jgi:hypothetical protein
VQRGKKKVPTVETGTKKCKRGYGGAYGGVWRSLRLAGVWGQAAGFVSVLLEGM